MEIAIGETGTFDLPTITPDESLAKEFTLMLLATFAPSWFTVELSVRLSALRNTQLSGFLQSEKGYRRTIRRTRNFASN